MKIIKYKYVLILSLLVICRLCPAQDSVRVVSGAGGEREYIINEARYDRILNKLISYDLLQKRIDLLKEQNAVLLKRSFLADSALKISDLESRFWYNKLQENDRILEEERIKAAGIWHSKMLWFVIGALTASVVIAVN
jgi:hypothetical protein